MTNQLEGYAEDLLITALEGGSNYWYYLPDLSMIERRSGDPLSIAIFNGVWSGGKIVPVHDNEERDNALGNLTRESMEGAFTLMRQTHPRHYADIYSGNVDAETADVWFQLAVMREVIYG